MVSIFFYYFDTVEPHSRKLTRLIPKTYYTPSRCQTIHADKSHLLYRLSSWILAEAYWTRWNTPPRLRPNTSNLCVLGLSEGKRLFFQTEKITTAKQWQCFFVTSKRTSLLTHLHSRQTCWCVTWKVRWKQNVTGKEPSPRVFALYLHTYIDMLFKHCRISSLALICTFLQVFFEVIKNGWPGLVDSLN